ncbi:hypothetical protein KAFR_0F02120 [Kazachstania africana CBS 2517]|uniref:U1-type domain-containing protein n=1 Tax=Kazachstania africana (strain ATCC 22294 / BCRC 22015 / CBS 2517 / CECT 1963 / NBRC 1671 / NRRL Y-8276) TaxID=1071382 RepID=H2AWQ9_KAZAF|nr:hypothetical protein KAFR_0F02120 [Kazachstania africana CBS 2517]CCF58809.1 hypothetical protein KAFR_0F02120 [Kazachstania africana CBS 2517]
MDYHNRAGSKKGGGGLASESHLKLQRRKQVDELLRQNEEIPYTFQKDEADDQTRKSPYIYKNHSGKLVCKLCNTMHVSWSSVERHLSGKKHGLNVIRRGKLGDAKFGDSKSGSNTELTEFELEVENARKTLKNNGIIPNCEIVSVKHPKTGLDGIAVKVDYSIEKAAQYDNSNEFPDIDYPPFIRIVSGLELSSEDDKDKKFLVIAYEPFDKIGIEIPNKEIIMQNEGYMQENSVDELNSTCTYWDEESKLFLVQFFFKNESDEVKTDEQTE